MANSLVLLSHKEKVDKLDNIAPFKQTMDNDSPIKGPDVTVLTETWHPVSIFLKAQYIIEVV